MCTIQTSFSARSKNSGFTLIEILVVIVIISLLAAIMFPVFGRARENARRSSCQSNLKQIGLGLMQYLQDNDEVMPIVINWSSLPNDMSAGSAYLKDSYTWRTSLYPYLKSAQLFYCPSYQKEVAGNPDWNISKLNWQPNLDRTLDEFYLVGGYTANARSIRTANNMAVEPWKGQLRGPFNGTVGYLIKTATIDAISTKIFVSEKANDMYYRGDDCYFEAYQSGSDLELWATPGITGDFLRNTDVDPGYTSRAATHLGGCNYLFGDGHVKWYSPDGVAETSGNPWKSIWTIGDYAG